MARKGVTDAQVHKAADELLLAGDRPTIERLRAHLGTGSPNTVLRALETWWGTLGQRLAAQQVRLVLPNAPEGVVAAANQLWEQALSYAQEWARTKLASEREALATQRDAQAESQRAWENERQRVERELMEAQAHARELASRVEAASASLSERIAQIQDLKQEQATLIETRARAEQRALELQQRLDAHEAAANAKLEGLRVHGQKSEERWLGEVDRLRQELKNLRKKHEGERHGAQEAVRQLQKDLLEATRARTDTERNLAMARAEAMALDRQLQRITATLSTSGRKRSTQAAKETLVPEPARAKAAARRRR